MRVRVCVYVYVYHHYYSGNDSSIHPNGVAFTVKMIQFENYNNKTVIVPYKLPKSTNYTSNIILMSHLLKLQPFRYSHYYILYFKNIKD